MSETDCSDICDCIISIMCTKCPNYKECQNAEDDANHGQMQTCIINGVLSNPDDKDHTTPDWPKEFKPLNDTETEDN